MHTALNEENVGQMATDYGFKCTSARSWVWSGIFRLLKNGLSLMYAPIV